MRALFPELREAHVLHLLCGTGAATAGLVEQGAFVTAVEISPDLLAVARKRVPSAAVLLADPNQLPAELLRGRFDLVYGNFGLLSWIRELDAFAAELSRAIRDGGRLVLHDAHPVAESLDLPSLRWRGHYFGEDVWQLGETVTAVARAGFVVQALEELPSAAKRVPGEFVLVALKPEP
jgi:SAM-dependent methyltransferase